MSYTIGSDAFIRAFNKDIELERFFSTGADMSAMLDFEKSLARAQSMAGLIPHDHGALIASVLDNFEPNLEQLHKEFARDGVVPPSFVRQISQILPSEIKQSFHLGVTSQDLIDTSLMIRLRRCLACYDNRIRALDERLSALALKHAGARVLQARTRMQNALPISVPEKIMSWRSQLSNLMKAMPTTFPLQLGGPEGAARKFGQAYQDVQAAMAQELGLDVPQHHWQTDRSTVMIIAFWCSQVASVAGKIAQDILFMVQTDVGEVTLESGGASSAMPHKKNPVLPEIIVAQARYCHAQMGGLNTASIHENERSGSAWTLEWMLLPSLVIVAGCTLTHMDNVIASLAFRD